MSLQPEPEPAEPEIMETNGGSTAAGGLPRTASRWSEDGADANDENELATIRVRTMFGLVEELRVAAGATDSHTHLLYLTNMQAQLFKAETVPKMLQAFELPQPSLVINLMGSFCYPCFFDCSMPPSFTQQERDDFYRLAPHNVQGNSHSFVSGDEATQGCRRLSSFFKEVLLPLAAETNAIVLCSARDAEQMSTTLAEVMPLFTAKYGGQLPFTVLTITAANTLRYNMLYNPDSFACELANKSKNWRKGLRKFEMVGIREERAGLKKEQWRRDDLQPGLVNYIIVEGVSGRTPDTWKDDTTPLVTFQNELLQALSAQLPTLCVRTGGSANAVPLTPNVELASRDIPVLMLDTQDRPQLGVKLDPEDPATRDELITKAIEANTARHH
eukprot:COSAG04_NODE_1248_length_7581_cov_24.589453_1_plen_386_part_10